MKSASNRLALVTAAAVLAACRGDKNAGIRVDLGDSGSVVVADPMGCVSCHETEFAEAKSAPHVGVRPTTCGACHDQKSWKPSRLEHPWWPLTGAHLRAAEDTKLAGTESRVKCFWCHEGKPAVFRGTKKACIACHAGDRERSTFPGHGDFATTCQDCHSTEAWTPTTKEIPRPVEVVDAGAEDAGSPDLGAVADAGVKKPKPKPPKPPPRPPDVITHPSRHRGDSPVDF